jgi:hypothetical protein
MHHVMKLSALVTWVGGVFCSPLAANEPGLVIADNGRSDYTIVIAADASDSEKHGAQELQMFLEEISGARLPIATDAETVSGAMILVGHSKKLEGLEGLEKIDFKSLGKEGFVIRTVPPHLILAGGRMRGSMYSVYTFLEDQLGCRWFAPTASRIPKRSRIEIGPLSERQVPRLEFRSVGGAPDWGTRNKLNAEIRVDNVKYYGVHTFHKFLPPKQYFDEHPEYYSLRGGERRNNAQLCLTNPEIVPLVAENVKKLLRERPDVNIVSVSQIDGFTGACQCPKCKELDEKEGSESATLINFVNQVADIVGAEYPDVAIGTLAYLYTKKPPKTIRPRPNVIIRMGTIQKCLSHPAPTCDFVNTAIFRENLIGWAKLTNRIHFWDYAICFHHYLLPFPNLDAHQPTIKYFADNSGRGVFYQTRMTGEMKLLRRYILAKCMWNPDVDVSKVKEEFLEGFFGPAGPPIGEYLDMIHKRVAEKNIHLFIWAQPTDAYLTPEILSRARELFDEAERRVEGNRELMQRVELARLAIQYTELSRPSPYVDSGPILEKFRAVVEREKIADYGETSKPMAGWLAEKDALLGPLPDNVVYDLYQNLGAAKAENCQMFEVKSIKKGDRMIPAIVQHPAREGLGNATYEIPLPALDNGKKLVLEYGTGFREPTANGVLFTILVDGTEVWSSKQEQLEPIDHHLDLSAWAGRTIALTLRVDALGNAAYDWSCWVRPQIQMVARDTPE